MNYKEEAFLNIDNTLQTKLEVIAEQMKNQLITPGQYLIFNDHARFGQREFNKFWEHIPINNLNGNKYSKNEYKGLYAFGEVVDGKLQVLYVGISQTIRRRYFKHTKEKSREGATWAYTILRHRNKQLSKEELVGIIPEIQSNLIKNCRFTFIRENDNMLMHLAEVFCANKLKAYWNSFETH